MDSITITSGDHPSPIVRMCDLRTDGPYLRQLWLPVVGPSTVALLGRCQELTARAGGTAEIGLEDLARSIGLDHRSFRDSLDRGLRTQGPFARTLVRASHFGLVDLWGDDGAKLAPEQLAGAHKLSLALWDQVAPLRARQVERLPEFLKTDHYEAMGPLIERLRDSGIDLTRFTAVGPFHAKHTIPAATTDATVRAVAQLDQMRAQQPAAATPAASL